MSKLEVGMYVRTKNGIGKVTECRKYDKWGYIIKILGKYSCFTHTSNKELSDVIKASFDIIDLIEVGDVITTINLCGEVTKIDKENNKIYATCYDGEYCHKEDIKSIVTKEQFESMSYRIGE